MVDLLNEEGFSVQLKHVEPEEGSGWVSIKDASGKELARSEDVQHNRNYSARPKLLEELGKSALKLAASA